MKKLGIVFFAVLLVVAFTLPAAAVETTIGGYWRTRAYSINNFTGEDESETFDMQQVDTRTRLYLTTVINDNLKFVNKFELDAVWGDGGNYGDIGTDGKKVEIKNSYADFNIGSVNFKIGAQGSGGIARGFLFWDDFAGAKITFNGEGFSVPFFWIKGYEGGMKNDSGWNDSNDGDLDYFILDPSFKVGDTLTVNPTLMYVTTDHMLQANPMFHFAGPWGPWASWNGDLAYADDLGIDFTDMDIYFLGLNLDADLGGVSVWFTGIYELGSIDMVDEPISSVDISAYLFAAGASADVGPASVRGQFFYASGQDLNDIDENSDLNAFWVPSQGYWYGQSYYWAEIMGYGTIDQFVSNGSPQDKISNVMAANIGATFKPMDKVSVDLDLWWAKLAEDDFTGESDLGTEIDLAVNYELVEGLNLKLVGAYLFAGDRTTSNIYESSPDHNVQWENDANPYELAAQLSLSF